MASNKMVRLVPARRWEKTESNQNRIESIFPAKGVAKVVEKVGRS